MAQTGKKYEPSPADCEYVFDCSSQGITVMKIIGGLDIDFKTWQKNLPTFSKHLKRGRKQYEKHLERRVPEVEDSLVKRAVGYEYEETSKKQHGKVVNGVLQNGTVEITTTKKHVPANPAAVFFFLTNHCKEKYKHAQFIDHTTGGVRLPPVEQYSDEEKAAIALALRSIHGGENAASEQG
jgi:hypothetical protein